MGGIMGGILFFLGGEGAGVDAGTDVGAETETDSVATEGSI